MMYLSIRFKTARALIAVSFLILTVLILSGSSSSVAAATVKIGLNYPASGPYWIMGLAQNSAATMAVEEINANGGILGNTVELVRRDSKSKTDVTTKNVNELINNENGERSALRMPPDVVEKILTY